MASDLRSGPTGVLGLSSADAAERRGRDGPNALPARPRMPVWRRVLAQLRDPLIIVLLIAVALTVFTGDLTDAAVIALVIVVNTSVGVVQEVKADHAITALATMTAPEARVVRDGRQQMIPAVDVVAGDLLVLAEGDIVPADASLTETAALMIDESALTGESVPVDKSAASGDGVCSGTVVVRGRGQAVVTVTGAASAMGRIAGLMGTGSGLTPLQHRLVGVGRALAAIAVVLCTVVLALGLARGESPELMVVTAISLVVAAVPESLPAVVTLALGARRMAVRHALIRRLPAVETLGSVTVIATDKTGTLTEGRMVVRRLWTPFGAARADGPGYGPDGAIERDGTPVTTDNAPDLADLLTAAALCTDATLRAPEQPDGDWTALGDPTEAALLTVAVRFGIDPTSLKAALPRVGELPFDSDRKRMTTLHRRPGGGIRAICKGAPEVLLAARFLDEPADLIRRAADEADALAAAGYRVLAVARSDHAVVPPAEEWEHGLRLLGLLGIRDPARPSAAATIAACRAAGITPVLITGDHLATARAVAAEVGIIDGRAGTDEDDVVDCREPAFADRIGHARVFARATPEQKLDIVTARRQGGDIVAMTGDGVNDGPALRRADIGVAMGLRGTEVARQAADLVLADDDLATVVAAAEEGRRVYANIRRFLLYGLSGGAAEIAVMLAGPFLGLPLFLLPAQILWINLLTHGLPGVALGSEPAPPDVMDRPPRPPAESVLGAGLWQRILRVGVVISAVTLGVAVWGHATDRPWQSMAFFALGATQLAVAVGSRARPGTRANPMLLLAVGVALALQFAGLYLPVLNELLGTRPVPMLDLLVICALSGLGYAAIRLDRVLHRGSGDDGRT
jgi:Ca2+-transporting ATPase